MEGKTILNHPDMGVCGLGSLALGRIDCVKEYISKNRRNGKRDMRNMISGLAMMLCIVANPAHAESERMFIPEGYSEYDSPGIIELDRPMDIVKDWLSAFPESLEGAPRLELKSYLDRGDRLIIDVVESGLLDDSISAINQRYAFKQNDDGTYTLWSYGYRHQCARGEDIENWVTTPCP